MFTRVCPYCGASMLGRPIEEQGLADEFNEINSELLTYVVVVICECGKKHGDFLFGTGNSREFLEKITFYKSQTHLQERNLK